MEAVYGIISYQAHDEPASLFASQAIAVLKDIESSTISALPTFLSANSILTISGVRSYDAYHEFYDNVSREDALKVKDVLKAHGIHLIYGSNTFSKHKTRVFEILNEHEFVKLWGRYKFPLYSAVDEVGLKFNYNEISLIAWSELVELSIADAIGGNIMPRAWLNDWYSPFNIRFGMMLGYPSKAIESLLWQQIGLQHEREADAKIHHRDSYFAAQPVYSYESNLKNDQQIVAHQELWSAILDKVYSSQWHTELKQKPEFKKALAELTKHEKPSE